MDPVVSASDFSTRSDDTSSSNAVPAESNHAGANMFQVTLPMAVAFSDISFGEAFSTTLPNSYNTCGNPNDPSDPFTNGHFGCALFYPFRIEDIYPMDDDLMSSESSSVQESLFDYSPSQARSNTTTTVSSGTVQQEMTQANLEHMLGVLKVERENYLAELREFDAALETMDGLAKDRPESKIRFHCVCQHCSHTRCGRRVHKNKQNFAHTPYERRVHENRQNCTRTWCGPCVHEECGHYLDRRYLHYPRCNNCQDLWKVSRLWEC